MKENFEQYQDRLKPLRKEVRKKALEFARENLQNNDYSEEKALEEGIKEAEIWYRSLMG